MSTWTASLMNLGDQVEDEDHVTTKREMPAIKRSLDDRLADVTTESLDEHQVERKALQAEIAELQRRLYDKEARLENLETLMDQELFWAEGYDD